MPRTASASEPQAIGFLLIPRFSMMAFASAIEPLRVANRLAGRTLFSWEIVSSDGAPVAASNGMALVADRSIRDHMNIIEALEARDTVRAENLVRQHALGLAEHVARHADYLDKYDHDIREVSHG